MKTENQQSAPRAIVPIEPPPGANPQPGARTVPGGYPSSVAVLRRVDASDELPQVTTGILPAEEAPSSVAARQRVDSSCAAPAVGSRTLEGGALRRVDAVPPSGPAVATSSTAAGATDIPAGVMPGSKAGEVPAPTSERAARPSWRIDWRVVGLVLVAGLLLGVWRAVTVHAKAGAKPVSGPPLVSVAVAKVTRQDLYNEVSFPAEFRPYEEVELHAKVSGYVRDIPVDFGDRVKAGQLLATLEVPELQDELRNAFATEQKAEADYTNAHLIYERLATVNQAHPNLIAQQDLDTAQAKDLTTAAAIAAAKAEVEKYHTLVDYTRITAPFDGVVTKRYADPGTLIQAGTASDTQSLPLVRVSDNYRLRLDFPVDVPYVKDVHPGDTVEVRMESLGGKAFSGKISRTSLKVDDVTRTMITEVEVANPDLELVPGMYATVALRVALCTGALAVPPQAVATGKKSLVYVVNGNQEIEPRPVKLGLETPDKLEVSSGLKEGELVVVGGLSQLKPGQKVEAKLIGPVALQ